MRNMNVALLGRVILADSITFVFEAVFVRLAKSFFTPESHRHQTRHIERGARRRDRTNEPD